MLRRDPAPHQGLTERIPVIAAVILRDGSLLVAQRAASKRHGGMWEFPGGKVEPGETHLEAARRELQEELGLAVTGLGRHLVSFTDPGSPFVIEFVEVHATGEPVPAEHQAVTWASREAIRLLALAPADARFVAWLEGEAG